MNKPKLILFLAIFVFSVGLKAQDNNQKIFIQAVTELYNESQKNKAKYEAQYEASKKNISEYQKEKPKVSVFGGTAEQNQKLEEEVQEILSNNKDSDDEPVFEDLEIVSDDVVAVVPPPPPPPLPPTEKRNKSKKVDDDEPVFEDIEMEETMIVEEAPPPPPPPTKKRKKKKDLESIEFTTTAMFPNETKGLEIQSKGNKAKNPKKKEKIEWVEGPTFTTSYEIDIDDIKDPKEKKRLLDYGDHYSNVTELNRIGFIESIYNDSKDATKYQRMMTEFKKYGYDFDSHFRKMSILEKSDQVPFIKSKIAEMVEKVVQ